MSGKGCRQAEESGEGLAVSSQGMEESQAGPRAACAPTSAAAGCVAPPAGAAAENAGGVHLGSESVRRERQGPRSKDVEGKGKTSTGVEEHGIAAG